MKNHNDRKSDRLTFARTRLDCAAMELSPASADAGFRSYWRTEGCNPTRIIMDSPPGLDDPKPWLQVHDLLAEGGVRVPAVLARDLESGFLLLEDLGSRTMLAALTQLPVDDMFEAAIDELIRLQGIAPPADFPQYDRALLMRELRLFDQWFLRRHLGVPETELAGLDGIHEFLLESALAQPRLLTHRDFMARNLMPQADGRMAVIDFQDAVVGPLAYDMLCLCKDAFHSWPEAQVDAWREQYRQRAAVAGLAVPGAAQFRRDFELIGVHRHLKVLGIFARLCHRDHKPRYIADAPRFVGYLQEVTPRYPELEPLDRLLKTCVMPRLPAACLPA